MRSTDKELFLVEHRTGEYVAKRTLDEVGQSYATSRGPEVKRSVMPGPLPRGERRRRLCYS